MGGRSKKPIELLEYTNTSRLTKAEISERRKMEIKAPNDNIKPPTYLKGAEKKEFFELAGQLLEIGIMSNLDCDSLAQYIQSKSKYKEYDKLTSKLLKATKDVDIEEMGKTLGYLKEYENLRDKALKQCRGIASDLGLTISSRCKLVVPQAPAPKKENKFTKFSDTG